jgi:hypothetical protein
MYQCRLSTRYLLLMQEYYVQLHVIVDARNYKQKIGKLLILEWEEKLQDG